MKVVPPKFKQNTFTCPHCTAIAKQRWGYPQRQVEGLNEGSAENFSIARCDNCNNYSVWMHGNLAYPIASIAPEPNPDLPEDIKLDFNEARQILQYSPRGSAALLRLCIQKICKHLGESGKNINNDIASLVKKGLPLKVQQALDIVRVVGNNAVHPGQIELTDDANIANKMFALVNLIADVMITQPKHVQEMFEGLIPENLQEAITQRDDT